MREGWFVVRARRSNGERGASLVEFALVVPLLTLFLFGIVQFGIAYDMKQSINSAAREGARLGALPETTVGEIKVRSTQAYEASASSGTSLTVDVYGGVPGASPSHDDVVTPVTTGVGPCGSTTTDYEFVRVEVSTPYDITIPFFGVHAVTIDSEAEFRCE